MKTLPESVRTHRTQNNDRSRADSRSRALSGSHGERSLAPPMTTKVPNVRRNDPDTSRDAALRSQLAHPDQRAAFVVAAIMSDGLDRTDKEIASYYADSEYWGEAPDLMSADRLRHGRKLLHEQGRLKLTGDRRDGCRVWIKCAECHACRRDMSEVPGGIGNVTHDGKLWCGCASYGQDE